MAKARWLRPEFFTDPKVCRVSDQAALVFAALWVEADDGGVAPGDPAIIYGRRFITRPGWSVDTVKQCFSELSAGLVQIFASGDSEWVLIPNLMRNQGTVPKKWRHLGEQHEVILKQLFGENQGNAVSDNGKQRTKKFPPKLLLKPKAVAGAEGAAPVPAFQEKAQESDDISPQLDDGDHLVPVSPLLVTGSERARAMERLTTEGASALAALLRTAPNPEGVVGEVNMILDGGRSGTPTDPAAVSLALADLVANGRGFGASALRAYVTRAAQGPSTPTEQGAWDALIAKAEREEQSHAAS